MKKVLSHPVVRAAAAIFAWTLLVYGLLEAGGSLLFDVEVLPRFWLRDFVAHLLLSTLIFLMARNFKI